MVKANKFSKRAYEVIKNLKYDLRSGVFMDFWPSFLPEKRKKERRSGVFKSLKVKNNNKFTINADGLSYVSLFSTIVICFFDCKLQQLIQQLVNE